MNLKIKSILFSVCLTFVSFPVFANMFDDFTRPDNAALGNGWIEKSPGAFTLISGEVQKQSVSDGYLDNVVYRPAVEDLLDAESSIEINLTSNSPGFPQVLVRVQSSTIATPYTLDAYMLYINGNTTQAILGRNRNGQFVTTLTTINLTTALNTTDTFRMRIRATGTLPVTLEAFVERFNGSTWDIIGQGTASDSSAERIDTAGSVGFSGYVENVYRYDNFRRVDLSGSVNPFPVISALSPNSATVGGSDFLMTVNGTDFVNGATVRWGGADLATVFVSATELQATVPGSLIATSGVVSVTTFNPAPGGGLSNTQTFNVNDIIINPLPVISGITPSTATVGGSAFLLTINGTDFIASSSVRWNGVNRATTYISATQLQATITATDIDTIGTANVTVFTTAPGGGTSNSQTLTIQNIAAPNSSPIASTLAPNSIDEDSIGFTLTVNGADFVPGSIVRWNGADQTTAFINTSQLQAPIFAADLVNPGTVNVTVFSPSPGGGESQNLVFTINTVIPNPSPAISTLTPAAVFSGTTNFLLTVDGTGFINSTIVRWNGADLTTMYISNTQLQANVPDIDLVTVGSATITVFNTLPGGGESTGTSFAINAPPPSTTFSIISVTPDFEYAGTSGSLVTINGNDFAGDTVVRWNGSDRPTTFISSNELQAVLTITDLSSIGVASVTAYSLIDGTTEPLPFIILDPASNYFSENFNRPDGADIGNNWTEKTATTYSLQGGRVVGVNTEAAYTLANDNIVHRPDIEDIQDVELSIEFIRQTYQRLEFPQLHARVQRDTITDARTLASYILYVEDNLPNPPMVAFAINEAVYDQGECVIDLFQMPADLVPGERYRLRFRVTGTYPVQMTGYVDRYTGQSWELFASGSATHDNSTQPHPFYCDPGYMPPPIMTAGSIGFSKWWTETQVYDNFYWVDLSGAAGANPVPVVSGMTPSSIEAQGSDFSLTINGTGFVPSSAVLIDGASRTTSFISNTQLQATITAADISTDGTALITVFTPAPGGGSSVAQTLTITPAGVSPVPVISSLVPNTAIEGNGGVTININGLAFENTSVVRWDGLDRATTYISATQLQASITATDLALLGTANVSVFTPAPGGGLSGNQVFTILASSSGFIDGFDRVDSTILGNNWIEKNPSVFILNSGQVAKQSVSTGYRDNIVYRPSSEDILDAETSIVFNLTNASPGYPQLFTRVQSSTVAVPDVIDGYMLYVDDSTTRVVVGRQLGNNFLTELGSFTVSPALNTTDTFRLRMSAVGTNPVVVTGYVERFNGASWDIMGQGTYTDIAASRIVTPGTSGFSGYIETSYIFDNFSNINLSP